MKSPAKKAKASTNYFAKWGRQINWKKRVKAVCKPCWEIKYCPYGPLVEQFPLSPKPNSKSCRIFGHDCPVFHTAEPLTETKELRRISREITRPVQFRVLKRENQICSSCGKSVQDGNIHFDHIIPFSKGGSSDESNIRLLCDNCNLKRSNRFEAEHLVTGFIEHTSEHLDLSFLEFLLDVCRFGQDFHQANNRFPTAAELSDELHDGTVSVFEESLARTLPDLSEFFRKAKPTEMTLSQMRALKARWGFTGNIRSLAVVANEFEEDVETLVILERSLLAKAGWYIKEDKFTRRKWAKQ